MPSKSSVPSQSAVAVVAKETVAAVSDEVSDVVAYKTETAKKLSLRAKGVLTYQLGYVESIDQLFIRLQSNATGGYVSKEWVPFEDIQACLLVFSQSNSPLSASALKGCFVSKSQNNAGFLAASLKAEGLLMAVSGKSNLLSFNETQYQSWLELNLASGREFDSQVDKPSSDSSEKSNTKKEAGSKTANRSNKKVSATGTANKTAENVSDLPEETL